MTERENYIQKARESLAGAESELVNGRYSNCANRCYYACSQAAVAALIQEDIRPSAAQWSHMFVHGQFVGQLINRRKRYPTDLRATLARLQLLRHEADYGSDLISQSQALRAVPNSTAFVIALDTKGGESS